MPPSQPHTYYMGIIGNEWKRDARPDTSFTKFTAQQFKKDLNLNYPQILEMFRSDINDRSYQFWQRDSLATRIFSKEMLLQKLEYMHTNPMQERWNLAESPEKYHWSSANFLKNKSIILDLLRILWINFS